MKISRIKEINNHFCLMPWFGLTISGNGGIRPCCDHKMIYNIHHDPPPSNFYNCREFIGLRKVFLEGKRPIGCQRCWEHEEQVGVSRRINFNNKIIKFIPNGYLFKERLRRPQWLQIDISFSNRCNLKCRMCGIWGSAEWLNEEIKLGRLRPDYHREKRLEYLQLTQNDLNNIKFLLPGLKKNKFMEFRGGEPFLADDHIKFLKYLIKNNLSQNLNLRYNTNGTVINDDILKLLSYFKGIHIVISVDGLGSLYKYIRGGNYSFETDIVENIKKFNQLDNVFVSFAVAVSAYNILSLSDLHKYLNNLNIKRVFVINAFKSLVHKPTYLSPFILPLELRHLAHKRLKDIKEFDSLRKNLVCKKENKKEFVLFKNFTNFLDKTRNENVLDVIPELKKYW